MPNLFQTGSGASSATIQFTASVPDVNWFKRALLQALYLMTDTNNWTQQGAGAESIESAAQYASEMIISSQWGDLPTMRHIGEFMDYAGSIDPMPAHLVDEWLWCNGAEVLIDDYPELYAVIGRQYTFPEVPVDQFSLPDFRDRSPMYAAADTQLGVYDGNAEITLSAANIPAHTHTIARGGSGAPSVPQVSLTTGNNSSPFTTGSTGEGTPFSIVHPVLLVNRLIKAK